jgi:hypothetical protein
VHAGPAPDGSPPSEVADDVIGEAFDGIVEVAGSRSAPQVEPLASSAWAAALMRTLFSSRASRHKSSIDR